MKSIKKYNDYLLITELLSNVKKILSDKDIPLDDERFLELKELTKNNPSYIGLLTHYVFEMGDSIEDVKRVMGDIKKYSQLLKNNEIVPIDMIMVKDYKNISNYSNRIREFVKSNNDKIYRYFFLEELEDTIKDIIVDNDKKKFVKKFISNKYKHLVNGKTIELFYILKGIGDELKWKNPHEKIQNLLTDKLKVYKSPEELNKALETTIEQISGGWDTDTISEEVEDVGGYVIYKDDRFVIVDTDSDKYVIDELGSPKWCIVYSDSQFENYTKFPNKQYIVYDTSLDRTDDKSMIGVTMYTSDNELGKFYTAHDRSDKYVNEKYFIDLGIREYLKGMGKEELGQRSDELSISQLLKYGLSDIVIEQIESGVLPIGQYLKQLTELSVKYDFELFKYLNKNYGIEKNEDFISHSSQTGNVEVLKYLHEEMGMKLDIYDGTQLLSAISNGHYEVVKYLLENGVDPNVKLFNALYLAVDKKNGLEIVKLLVEHGIDITRSNNKAIERASDNGYVDIVKYLYEQPGVKESLSDRDKSRLKGI